MPLIDGDDAAAGPAPTFEARSFEERGLVPALARWLGLGGGLLSLGLALLVTVSVLGRWSGIGSVPGDFELVQVGTALCVVAFLPLCQARRGNIVVDTFTGALSPRARAVLDAAWDLLYAAVAALIAYSLVGGARDAVGSGLSSMVLGLPLAPVFALCALFALLLCLTAAWTGARLLRTGA